jgi:hypothetical protein
MADSLLHRGKPDRSVIKMSEGHEVRYWCKHLGVTVEVLRRAVDTVGNSAAAVRKQLGKTDDSVRA